MGVHATLSPDETESLVSVRHGGGAFQPPPEAPSEDWTVRLRSRALSFSGIATPESHSARIPVKPPIYEEPTDQPSAVPLLPLDASFQSVSPKRRASDSERPGWECRIGASQKTSFVSDDDDDDVQEELRLTGVSMSSAEPPGIDTSNSFMDWPSADKPWWQFFSFLKFTQRIPGRVRRLYGRMEGWILAALIAMATSFCAAWIEIAVKFFSDLRIGLCQGMLWHDRAFCCGSRSAVDFDQNSCSVSQSPVVHMSHVNHAQWYSWSALLHVEYWLLEYFVDYAFYLGIAVALAVLAAWLCVHFAPAAAGSGIPEVKTILGGFVVKQALDGWVCLIKCIGLSLAVASGLALGKEGPLVHVACCWANLLGKLSARYSDDEGKRRELLSAASAAGVSVAFGAPLGGVLFSLEEVSSYFPPKTLWKSFFCAVVGALSLKYLDASGSGRLTMFQMDSVSLIGTWQIVELIPFAFIGFLGGAIGTVFIRLNVYWMQRKRSYRLIADHPIYEVAIVTLITSLVNYPLAMLRSPSSTLLEQMFGRCGIDADLDFFNLCSNRTGPEASYSDYSLRSAVFVQLGLAFVLRFLETVFTFGISLPAGLFIPSLTAGALCGRLVGLLAIKFNSVFGFVGCHKCIHPGVYAIVGAAATLGGVTRVTISIVVIMFELTGGLSYVVPFMVAVIVAKWVGEALLDKSIYDCYIKLKGYPSVYANAVDRFTTRAEDLMESRLVVVCLHENTVGSLERKMAKHDFFGYPLINSREERLLIGFIQRSELLSALQLARADPRVDAATPVRFLRHSERGAERHQRSSFMLEARRSIRRNEGEELMPAGAVPPVVPAPAGGEGKTSVTVVDLSAVVNEQAIQLVPETPLGQIGNIFRQLDLKVCLLTHRGRLEGLLTKSCFLKHIQKLGKADRL